jgi:FixJ family two-component response regulator
MGDPIPMIFATRFADVETCVRAMKAGAADFLVKPVRDQQFLDSIVSALEKDRERILRLHMVTEVKIRYRSLSQREREVMSLAVAGMLNKNIADHLGLSEITVKIHRGNAMRKMQAKTLANLVTMAHSLGIVNFNAHCRNTDEVAVSIGE